MTCFICHKKQDIKETFYTNKDGRLVCINCLGFKPKSLHEIQAERMNKVNLEKIDKLKYKYGTRIFQISKEWRNRSRIWYVFELPNNYSGQHILKHEGNYWTVIKKLGQLLK